MMCGFGLDYLNSTYNRPQDYEVIFVFIYFLLVIVLMSYILYHILSKK